MHCDSHKVHDLIDSDDEYDDLLGDISKWGDKKDAATSKTCRIDFDIFFFLSLRTPFFNIIRFSS